MPSPLSSLALNEPADAVAAAVRVTLEQRGWQALQKDPSQIEALYRRVVTEPEATKWLPGPHNQYLVVLVTRADELRSTVTFMMSEYEPRADQGTSFALTVPEKFIEDFEGFVQDVQESLRVKATSKAGATR